MSNLLAYRNTVYIYLVPMLPVANHIFSFTKTSRCGVELVICGYLWWLQ